MLTQPIIKEMILVMAGGALGALSRFGVGVFTAKTWGTQFPWGTLFVNLSGCFLIGLIFGLAERFRVITPDFRLFFITGYLGALTTFSSFAIETVSAGRAGMLFQSLLNILLNNAGGIGFAFAGVWLVKFIK